MSPQGVARSVWVLLGILWIHNMEEPITAPMVVLVGAWVVVGSLVMTDLGEGE